MKDHRHTAALNAPILAQNGQGSISGRSKKASASFTGDKKTAHKQQPGVSGMSNPTQYYNSNGLQQQTKASVERNSSSGSGTGISSGHGHN